MILASQILLDLLLSFYHKMGCKKRYISADNLAKIKLMSYNEIKTDSEI